MELVRFQDVKKSFGHGAVLAAASFQINTGAKVGLIGANGAGKTTLLRLLLGEDAADAGAIVRTPGARIGYVPQTVAPPPGANAMDFILEPLLQAEEALREAEHRLAEAAAEDLDTATAIYESARAAHEHAGGDLLPTKAEAMLDALGLGGRGGQSVEQLSGGEKNVLALARALLTEPDLLVLDEPGNHLDFSGLAWLERFLRDFKGAVLIVSHNRYLLDRVATTILHLHDGVIDGYAGNYSAYRAQALRDKVAQRADYVANQKRLTQLEDLVRRFREIASRTSDPGWGKRLRARVSQLDREREQAVEKPADEASKLRLTLTADTSRADVALQVRGYSRAFGEQRLFEDADLDIGVGQRVAIIGPNGCGKTTFLRDVLAKGAWDADVIRIGPSLRVGYCAQEQDILDDSRTVVGQMLLEERMTSDRAFSVLTRFMFGQNDLDKRVGDLSGGERNRLQLALLSVRRADFLILDEPTNHLDIPACEAIEDALADFTGTVLVVSHDRYFLDKVSDRVVEVQAGKFVPFTGNFSEYWAAAAPPPVARRARVSTRSADRNRDSRPAARAGGPQADALAAKIEAAEREREALEQRVAAAFSAGDHREGQRASKLLEQQRKRVEELYGRWLGDSR